MRVVRPAHVADECEGLLWPDGDRLIEPAPYKELEIGDLDVPLKRLKVTDDFPEIPAVLDSELGAIETFLGALLDEMLGVD